MLPRLGPEWQDSNTLNLQRLERTYHPAMSPLIRPFGVARGEPSDYRIGFVAELLLTRTRRQGRLRCGRTRRTIPATTISPPTTGGTLNPLCRSLVTSSGPASRTFSFCFQKTPPESSAAKPTTSSTKPTILRGVTPLVYSSCRRAAVGTPSRLCGPPLSACTTTPYLGGRCLRAVAPPQRAPR